MSKALEDLQKDIQKEAELLKRKKEVEEKRLILNERKTNYELEKMVESDRSQDMSKKANFGALSQDQIARLVKKSSDYMSSAKTGMQFINSTFDGIVPFFRNNLILIGGKTGEGKSTTVANIARNIIRQKNPQTGKIRTVLIVTNEENAEDVYHRITCLGKGWAYANHDKFTEQQIKILNDSLELLAGRGVVTVIDNTHSGPFGQTTTIEGIKGIFDNLIENEIYYDCILIDYYQNIKSSSVDIYMNEFEAQARLANMLDQYKNEYPAPIVVMSQVKPPTKDEEPFEFRIKGRKIICDPSTFIMEMVADRARLRTEWIVHKSRFTESVNKKVMTGYKNGRFVNYDAEFQAGVAKYLEEKEMQKMNALTGVKEEDK